MKAWYRVGGHSYTIEALAAAAETELELPLHFWVGFRQDDGKVVWRKAFMLEELSDGKALSLRAPDETVIVYNGLRSALRLAATLC